MKQVLLSIAGLIVIILSYVIFVCDRVILAPFPRHQPRFHAWADLILEPKERRYLTMWESTVRVVMVIGMVFIVKLFIL